MPFKTSSEILSQVELIKSEQLARAVVEKLKLTDDEEFMEGTPSLASYVLGGVGAVIDWFHSLLSRTSEASDEGTYDVVGETADTLRGGVDVDRTGRTYVLSVSYTAKSARAGVAHRPRVWRSLPG